MIDTTRRISTDGDLRRGQLTAFYNALSKRGVEVAQADVTDEGGISLEYSIEGVSDQEAIADVNGIVGAFIGAQESSDPGGLEATVYGDEGGTGTWYVKPDWVGNYQRGEWDSDRLIEAVFESYEVN